MHKITAKKLRFGCGASLQSAFLQGHPFESRALDALLEKDLLMKTINHKLKPGGSRK